jgi:hypothetical protein
LNKIVGFIGAFILLIGSLSIFVDLPYIGRYTSSYYPTLTGIIFLLLAIASFIFIFSGKIKLLYITGIGSLIIIFSDLYLSVITNNSINSTLIENSTSSIVSNISQITSEIPLNSGSFLPYTWIILIIGSILIIISPLIGKKKQEKVVLSPKEEELNERILAYEKIKAMHDVNGPDNEELTKLKKEFLEFKKNKK